MSFVLRRGFRNVHTVGCTYTDFTFIRNYLFLNINVRPCELERLFTNMR